MALTVLLPENPYSRELLALLGPLLPLNPQFALSLMQVIAPEAEFAPLPYEEEAYRRRVEELSRPTAKQKHH